MILLFILDKISQLFPVFFQKSACMVITTMKNAMLDCLVPVISKTLPAYSFLVTSFIFNR